MGAGAYYNGVCLCNPWSAWHGASALHINMKEVLALEPAVTCWAPLWVNKKNFVHTDNVTAASVINKAMSKNPFIMNSLRRIFWLSTVYNFRLFAIYYPGARNVIADSLSRIEENGAIDRLYNALNSTLLC